MHNSNIPSDTEVPSTGKLIKSTILAVITAGVLLVTVVMPAEYGIDPTGVGNAIGLKRMGEIKASLAEEAAQDTAKDAQIAVVVEAESEPQVASETLRIQSHERQVTLAPDEGTEIKLIMAKGAKVAYVWETNGDKANFDVHGDSKKLKINYHSYSKGSQQKSEGTLEARFDGSHGWFWRNRTKEPLTITLKTNGEYTDIKRY
jgi:hypothetical protein